MTGSTQTLTMMAANVIGKQAGSYSKKRLSLLRKKTASHLDEVFLKLAKVLSIKNLIECGAHEASGSIAFLKNLDDSTALAIEANPLTYKQKTILAEQENLKTLNIGLGSKEGVLPFNFPKDNNTAGQASFIKRPNTEYDCIDVNVKPLDEVINTYYKEDTNLALWVDVEGLSYEVLLGAENTLEQCSLIKVEVETYELWKDQKTFSSTDKLLRDNGFCAVLRDFEYEGQFNVLYIKNSLLDKVNETLIDSIWKLNKINVSRTEVILSRLRKILHA